MAGSTHTQRQGWRPSTARSRTLAGMLESRRTAEADLRRAVYVRPYGRKWHIVRNICNGQEYAVADGLAFGRTFTEGTIVMLGSQSGRNGEFLIAGPPAGGIGASGYAVSAAYRSVGPVPVATYTDGNGVAWYDDGTLYTAWNATPEDPELPVALRLGSMVPEYLAMPPDSMNLGTESALIPSASTVLHTISPSPVGDLGPFAVFGGLAVAVGGDGLAVVNLSTGATVGTSDPPEWNNGLKRVGNVVQSGDRLFILEEDGDWLHAWDWPSLENYGSVEVTAPAGVGSTPIGIAPYGTDEVAIFVVEAFPYNQSNLHRRRFGGDLVQTQAWTVYECQNGQPHYEGKFVIRDGSYYMVPSGAGDEFGYLAIHVDHDADVAPPESAWPSGEPWAPEYAWPASVPAGDPVAGTEVDGGVLGDGLVRLNSNGTDAAYVEWVGAFIGI